MATVRKGSAIKRVAPVVQQHELTNEGDVIELSVTAEVKNRQGRSFWVKGGLSSSVRSGETTTAAKDRVSEFVLAFVEEQISEYLAD